MGADQDNLALAAAAAGAAGEGKGALAAEVECEMMHFFVAQNPATASVFGLDLEHSLLKYAGPVPLDLDGRVQVVLQELQNYGREVGGVEELIPRVPLDLRPFPLDLVLPHQGRFILLDEPALDLGTGFAFAVKESERSAEGRRRTGELDRVTSAENPVFCVFSHGPIVVRPAGLVKFLYVESVGMRPWGYSRLLKSCKSSQFNFISE